MQRQHICLTDKKRTNSRGKRGAPTASFDRGLVAYVAYRTRRPEVVVRWVVGGVGGSMKISFVLSKSWTTKERFLRGKGSVLGDKDNNMMPTS